MTIVSRGGAVVTTAHAGAESPRTTDTQVAAAPTPAITSAGNSIDTRTRIFDAPSTHPEDIRFREAQVDALRGQLATKDAEIRKLERHLASAERELAFYRGTSR